MAGSQTQLIEGLNALTAGLILLTAFGMVATRQVQGVMRFFVVQSAFLAASAFLIGFNRGSIHLLALGAITIAAKVIAIPWVLKRTLPGDLYERREINQVINIPSSLLLALLLAIAAEFLVSPLLATTADPVIHANLPIGLAGILIGAIFPDCPTRGSSPIDRHPRHGKWRLFCRHRNRSRSSSDCRIGNRDRCGSDRGRHWRTHAEYYANDWNDRSSIHERTERGASVMALIVAVSLPLLAALLCWVKPLRSIAWGITVFCLSISFAMAVMTAGQVLRNGRAVAIPGWIEVDGLGSSGAPAGQLLSARWLQSLLAATCVMAATQSERLWWFYSNSNLLVFALAAVPALASPNLVWVGVELVTLFATLLVGLREYRRRT